LDERKKNEQENQKEKQDSSYKKKESFASYKPKQSVGNFDEVLKTAVRRFFYLDFILDVKFFYDIIQIT